MYYGLSNYYQNHRRYVRSRDDNQIHGDTVSASTLNSDCEPYRTKYISSSDSRPIAPCGAIANSLFNGKLMKTHWKIKFILFIPMDFGYRKKVPESDFNGS